MLAADPMLGGSKEIRNMEFEAAQAGRAVRGGNQEVKGSLDNRACAQLFSGLKLPHPPPHGLVGSSTCST